jgi:hypothetical protein
MSKGYGSAPKGYMHPEAETMPLDIYGQEQCLRVMDLYLSFIYILKQE